jgi:hypothetical protein
MDDPVWPNAILAQWLRTLAETEREEWTRSPDAVPPTPLCLPLPRFRTALLRGEWAARDRAHVAGCSHCQKLEERMHQALWHPGPTDLFWHTRGLGTGDPDIAYHLETDECQRCVRLAAVFGADQVLGRWAELARQQSLGILERLKGTLATCFDVTSRQALPAGQAAFISQPNWSPAGSRFEYTDGLTTGFLYQDEGSFWLLLERSDLLPNSFTLLYVVLADGRGRIPWQRFLMFHPGFREQGHLARARLREAPPDSAAPTGMVVHVGLLQGKQMANLLRESFLAARRDDPLAVSSWQAWARRSLERADLDGRVRQVLQEIGRPLRD